jgi:hypothetical protein
MIRLRLLARPDCHLCERLRRDVDSMLKGQPHNWEIVNVDTDPELVARYGDTIPVLFVNGHLFAKIRLPRLASKLRLQRAAEREDS